MVRITVNEQRRSDMIVGALEGGSNYWYCLSNKAVNIIEKATPESTEPFSIRFWEAIKAGAEIPVNDAENEKDVLGKISLESIEKGEQSMADDYIQHFCDIVQETDDATTADIWFQLAVMNDVTYG